MEEGLRQRIEKTKTGIPDYIMKVRVFQELDKTIAEQTKLIKEIIEAWQYFCGKINFGSSALDAKSIDIMNKFELKQLDILKVLDSKK